MHDLHLKDCFIDQKLSTYPRSHLHPSFQGTNIRILTAQEKQRRNDRHPSRFQVAGSVSPIAIMMLGRMWLGCIWGMRSGRQRFGVTQVCTRIAIGFNLAQP